LAAAERREETGLRADDLRQLGHLYEAYGFCSQDFDVYLATGLRPGPPSREPTEGGMQHRQISEPESRAMSARGDIKDGATVAAYGLLLLDDLSR
jgi:8-oxo-dGTP pyrophosphatase MutT (NUDIX family)